MWFGGGEGKGGKGWGEGGGEVPSGGKLACPACSPAVASTHNTATIVSRNNRQLDDNSLERELCV